MKASLLILSFYFTCIFGMREKIAEGPEAADTLTTEQANIIVNKLPFTLPKIPPTMQSKPQIIIEREKYHKSEQNAEELKMEEPCKLKQGFGFVETKIQDAPGQPPIIFGRPAFVVLNKHSISFFDNENVHSLLDGFGLKDILIESDESFSSVNCFLIYKKQVETTGKTSKGRRLKTVCFERNDEMREWMKAIKEFHKCEVDEFDSESKEGGDKIKTKKRYAKLESDEELEERRTKDEVEREKDLENAEKAIEGEDLGNLDGMSEKIIEEFKRQKAMEELRRAKLEAERKNMEKRTQKLGDQSKCIEEALEVKAMEEEKMSEMILDEEKANKEKNLMSDALQKLKETWKSEMNQMSSQEQDLMAAQTQIQSNLKKEMIQETAEWTKNLDPSECYVERLTGGHYDEMKLVCANLVDFGETPDLKMLLRCLDRKYFCNECCNYYVGPEHEQDRLKCKERCEEVINSDANVYVVTYALKKQPANIVATAGG